MSPEQFCYWLQGFVEMNGGVHPTIEQWDMIGEHLSTVFKKVTPKLHPKIESPTDKVVISDALKKAIEDSAALRPFWPSYAPNFTPHYYPEQPFKTEIIC